MSGASLSMKNQRESMTISEIDDSSSAAAESIHQTYIRSYRQGALTSCQQFQKDKAGGGEAMIGNQEKEAAALQVNNSPENFTDGL